MAEVPATRLLRCSGCGRQFDDEDDVCTIPHVIGSSDAGYLCARCHVTVLGANPTHAFRAAELLA
jgi:DNA-directed RNA polymerase subunit RPC12/RpoP